MSEGFSSGLIKIFATYPELEGTQRLLEGAINYRNTGHDGKGHENRNRWISPEDFSSEFKYSESAFRTIQGVDHTYYVMDIDTQPEPEAFKMHTDIELRNIRLEAVMKIMEKILEEDNDFFAYLSGKGGYLIRKVYPNVDKQIFIKKTKKLLDICRQEHSTSSYCEQWHRRYGKRAAFYRSIKINGYEIEVGIDMILLEGDGLRVFRIPYSPYPKVSGGNIYVCAPVKFDGDKIDIKASLRNTDPRFTEVEDYTIPEEYMDVSDYEGIVIDNKAIKTTNYKDHLHDKVILDIPEPYSDLSPEQEAIIRRIEKDLTGEPANTPPCMKNAYIKNMPDGHWNRVLIGRYLYHRGYTLDEIALFIRNKINDQEDNAPENEGQMERNLSLFVLPTVDNPKLVPSCSKIQNPSGTFFACRPQDALACGRRNPMSKPSTTNASRAKQMAIAKENLIERYKDKQKRIPGIGKYNQIVEDVRKIITAKGNRPALVKKTTRAGLTTSLVIASKKEDKKALVLVPTNRIAKETFKTAVEIAEDIYKVPIKGAVMSSNPKGCLKIMLKSEQLKKKKERLPEWGASGVGLLKLPVIMKPPCVSSSGKCEFFDETIDVMEGDIITDSQIEKVGDEWHDHSEVTRNQCNKDHGTGKCARISVLKNITKFDTIFSTYAKLMATLNDEGDEAFVALSEIKDYDVIMLDEVSTLIEGQPNIIELAGRKDDEYFIKSDKIREQLSILVQTLKKSDKVIEINERVLTHLEDSIVNLEMNFIRGGVKTIVVENPLTETEREGVMVQYAILQNIVEKTNEDLSLLASFILAMTEEEWYLTAVTNMYGYTTISMITKPELTILRHFLANAQRQGKKIIVTDASLPPMSMKALLHLEQWDEVNLGDPRGTNDLSMIIPDTKKINISRLERSELEQQRVIEYAEKIIERHGENDVIIVMPNKGNAFKNMKRTVGSRFPNVEITYFRSDQTVGVAHDRRTMLAVCKPLPPEDAFNWLATHYSREQGADVSATSEMLRRHSARQAFYQTIGRVKDPSAAIPSVIYTYGTRKNDVKALIGNYSSPIVIESPSSKIQYRLITGTHWRRTAEILPTAISAAAHLIDERGRVTVNRLQKMMKEEDFRKFMKEMSTFGYIYDDKREIILASKEVE